MNLILYSYYSNELFTNKNKIFVKFNKILEIMGIKIHLLMNLIYKDLFNYL